MLAVSASVGGLGVKDLVSCAPPLCVKPLASALAYDSQGLPSIITALPLMLMPLTKFVKGTGVFVREAVGVMVGVGVLEGIGVLVGQPVHGVEVGGGGPFLAAMCVECVRKAANSGAPTETPYVPSTE